MTVRLLANGLWTVALVTYLRFKQGDVKVQFGNVKTKTKSLLRTLKIFDPDNTISLTNVGVMVLLTKIALAPSIDWPTTATLLLSLLSYNFKRHLNRKAEAQAQADDNKLAEVVKQVQDLNQAFNVKTMLGR